MDRSAFSLEQDFRRFVSFQISGSFASGSPSRASLRRPTRSRTAQRFRFGRRRKRDYRHQKWQASPPGDRASEESIRRRRSAGSDTVHICARPSPNAPEPGIAQSREIQSLGIPARSIVVKDRTKRAHREYIGRSASPNRGERRIRAACFGSPCGAVKMENCPMSTHRKNIGSGTSPDR
jgi:hypothetical protein